MLADEPAPSNIRLLPGETLKTITETPIVPTVHGGSSLAELMRLTGALHVFEIGERGPTLASLPLKEHASNIEFRKYEALFGRDALRVADTLLRRFPILARNTLLRLAETQGITFHAAREEEPGRIIHEYRDPRIDPIAEELTLERGWEWPYYGAVDATPQFIRVLTRYVHESSEGPEFLQQTYRGRDHETHAMVDALYAAVEWILFRMDSNPEGFLEYRHTIPNGIENQVWRDSWDSYFHADGTIANHNKGIASTEVQRGAMDALYDAADLYERYLYEPVKAVVLRKRAEDLRDTILGRLWTEDKGGYFVLGMDRDENGHGRQLRIRTSDMGHLLHSRLLEGNDPEICHKRDMTIKHLFSGEMICLNGIRTLAGDEIRFRPGAYHNGSVWPWQNYLISQGLERHGYYGLAHYINECLLADFAATHRSPEYLRGDSDPEHRLNTRKVVLFDATNDRENVVEQPPQDIQAWSTAAKYAIKHHRTTLLKHLRYEPGLALERQLLLKLGATTIFRQAFTTAD